MARIFFVEEDRNSDFSNYGRVEFEGKIYILDGQADCTSRLLPDPLNETHFEMSAPAHDEDGNEYEVCWIFENVENWELDQYDYDNIARIVEV